MGAITGLYMFIMHHSKCNKVWLLAHICFTCLQIEVNTRDIVNVQALTFLQHINNAAGSLHPAVFMGHKEHLNPYKHVETLMLLAGVCGQRKKQKKDEFYSVI